MNFFTHYSLRFKLILLVIAVLVLVVTATAQRYEEHCVEQIFPEDHTGTDEIIVSAKCFRTQAEAIRYATGGKIDLPDNASREEIHEALMRQ